eukprot:g135.t1
MIAPFAVGDSVIFRRSFPGTTFTQHVWTLGTVKSICFKSFSCDIALENNYTILNQPWCDMRTKTDETVNILGVTPDALDVCDICGDPSSEKDDNILYCDRCECIVHQSCYGVETVPEGDWFCRPCQSIVDYEKKMKTKESEEVAMKAPPEPLCVLCSNKVNSGGAFGRIAYENETEGGPKRCTVYPYWCHISCGRFFNETYMLEYHDKTNFTDYSYDPSIIRGIPKIDPQRFTKLSCVICKAPNPRGIEPNPNYLALPGGSGACVQCSEDDCYKAFHGRCAIMSGLHVDCGSEKKVFYCEEHTRKRLRALSREKQPKLVAARRAELSKRNINVKRSSSPLPSVQSLDNIKSKMSQAVESLNVFFSRNTQVNLLKLLEDAETKRQRRPQNKKKVKTNDKAESKQSNSEAKLETALKFTFKKFSAVVRESKEGKLKSVCHQICRV